MPSLPSPPPGWRLFNAATRCKPRARRSGLTTKLQREAPRRVPQCPLWFFSTLDVARQTIETWPTDYNDVRRQNSLDDTPPAEFAAAHQETAA